MLVWDNQQETSWFTGILEGEGYAGLTRKCPRITLTNTNTDIISRCVGFLNRNYILHGVGDNKRPNRKRVYTIYLQTVNNCYSLIKVLGSAFQCRYQEFFEKLQLGSSTTIRDTSLTSDRHWLVGIIEAEGYISLLCDNKSLYNPAVGIKNTNEKIIDKCVKTLKDLGLSWNVQQYKNDNPLHKRTFSLRIRGYKRCYRLLHKIGNLFRSARYSDRGKFLLDYCDSRLRKNINEPYSKAEHLIYEKMEMMI